MALSERHFTRVAVVQLDVHPAAVVGRRSPLEDPLFEFGKPDSLLRGDGTIPSEFDDRFQLLRQRIREVYASQLKLKLLSVLASCRQWKVRIVVFPEYSIPYDILGPISDASGEMVVIAGTHAVERDGLKSGLYEKLGWHGSERPLPVAGQAVCPVLYQGRLLALQAKLQAATPEVGSLILGRSWSPIEMPLSFPGPLGVMICKDFLAREDDAHRTLVAPRLDECRYLAVPSLTPAYTINEFGNNAWTEARRYGRPVLYANVAGRTGMGKADLGGGSSIFVDEGVPGDLRRFPEQVGLLESGNEGVIVADVDLGWEHRPQASTRLTYRPPIASVAAASLVYRRHPVSDAYARFVESFQAKLEPLLRDDPRDEGTLPDELLDELRSHRELLLQAGAFSSAETRNRRLQVLCRGLDRIGLPSELAKFVREIVLPPDALSLSDLRSALALSAADVLDSWIREQRGTGLTEVEERLRTAGQAASSLTATEWTESARASVDAIRSQFADLLPKTVERAAVVEARVELPRGLSPASLPDASSHGFRLIFSATPAEALRRLEEWFRHRDRPEDDAEARPFDTINRLAGLIGVEGSTGWAYLLAVASGAENVFVITAVHEADGTAMGFVVTKSGEALREATSNGPQSGVGCSVFRNWRGDDSIHEERLLPANFEKPNTRPQLLDVSDMPSADGALTCHWQNQPSDRWLEQHCAELTAALAATGLGATQFQEIGRENFDNAFPSLLTRFEAAQREALRLRDQRLSDVGGKFFEPTVRARYIVRPAGQKAGWASETDEVSFGLTAFEEWLDGGEKTALVLGEFGTGKSTLLAQWACRLWDRSQTDSTLPRPILCNLAGTGTARPESLLLEASGLPETPQNLAALELLIRAKRLLPIFDGFDEMATRVTQAELPERLASLLAVAGSSGRVVISSRDHYFPTEDALKNATDQALAKTLGGSSGVRRLTLQLLDQTQVEQFVRQVVDDTAEASAALQKIAGLYPLEDLVRRPLLLSMVLQTIDQFEAGARISQAGLYEAYLNRWLEQTDGVGSEIFSRDQKKHLAEEIALDLWQTGEASLSVEHLQDLIRDTLHRDLPPDIPFDAAFLEAFGGTFFVREGEDRFRFAHKSFLEFFLARVLVRELPTQPGRILDTRALTREVSAFVGELLRRTGDWQQSPVVLSVSDWLRARRLVSPLAPFSGRGVGGEGQSQREPRLQSPLTPGLA